MRLTGSEATGGGGENPVDARMVRIEGQAWVQHDPDPHRPVQGGPVVDRFRRGGIGRVDRLDQGEPARMRGMNLERIAGIVAVQGERRDQQGGVDADRIHGRGHAVAGDLGRSRQNARPRPPRAIPFIGVDLSVDHQHAFYPRSRRARAQ